MGNTFTTTTAAATSGPGSMTLTTARAWVVQFARNAAGAAEVYSAAQVDRAIQMVGNHFLRHTQILKTLSTVALAADSAEVSLAGLTGFRPDRLLRAYLVGEAEPLEIVDYEEVHRAAAESSATGTPLRLAFADWSTGRVSPTPDAIYSLQLLWLTPFTTWTPGTESPDDVTLNLPDEILAEILPYGPPAVLQHNEEEQRYASASWRKYLEIADSMIGLGTIMGQTGQRTSPWGAAQRAGRDPGGFVWG